MEKEKSYTELTGIEALKALQHAELDILVEIDKFCRKRNLIYYIAYGTLLGAVRHQGFIPWDDDIDLCMPRKDYEIFIKEFLEYFVTGYKLNHYSLEEYTTNSYILRVCNPKVRLTRVINNEGKLFDSFVSIFPIDGMPKDKIRRFILVKHADFEYTHLRFVRSSQNGYGNVQHTKKEKMGMLLNRLFKIGKATDVRTVSKKLDTILSKYSIDESDFINTYGYMVTPMTYNKVLFGKVKEYLFEGHSFYGPSNCDELLKIWYGDYMKLPPKDKQKPSHSVNVLLFDK